MLAIQRLENLLATREWSNDQDAIDVAKALAAVKESIAYDADRLDFIERIAKDRQVTFQTNSIGELFMHGQGFGYYGKAPTLRAVVDAALAQGESFAANK